MSRYLLRRFLQAIPTLFGVLLAIFLIFNVVGGDPALQVLGNHASEQRLAELRHEYGLDQPKTVQFAHYVKDTLNLDFGRSTMTRQRVSHMILEGLGPSLTLTIPAFFLTTVLALLLALLSASFKGRWLDRAVVLGCVVGMSIPLLFYILMGQYFVAFRLGLFPISGFEEAWPDRLYSVALPVLIWVLVSLGQDVRLFRTAFVEEMGQDYVRTARAKGASERTVVFKHVLKNGFAPVLTSVVIRIPFLVLGSFLLERFFSIPGLGNLTIDAIHNNDFPVLRAMVTLSSVLFVFGNLLTDLLYTWVDPRVTLK